MTPLCRVTSSIKGSCRFHTASSLYWSQLDCEYSTSCSDPFSSNNIFSAETRQRVVENLTLVKPPRTTKHVKLQHDHGTAAVLVPLCTVYQEPSLLLTLRSRKLAKYRGHVSFPGGNVDATDPDTVFTALRETEEELGLTPSTFDIWGQMNEIPATAGRGKMVAPIIASMGELDLASLQVSHDEVEEAFTVPLQQLCDPKHIHSTRFRSRRSYTIPVYTCAPHRIWGLTAIIIHMLLTNLLPENYTFQLEHRHGYR